MTVIIEVYPLKQSLQHISVYVRQFLFTKMLKVLKCYMLQVLNKISGFQLIQLFSKCSFRTGYSVILSRLVTVIYPLCFKRHSHQNFYCINPLKQSSLQTAAIFLPWSSNLTRIEKTDGRPSGLPQFFRSKVSTISAAKKQLFYIRMSK